MPAPHPGGGALTGPAGALAQGIDDRNQFDMLADLPGGLPGLKALVGAFHAAGVAVGGTVILLASPLHPSF